MAALGELLVYISTQNESDGDNNPSESSSKDSRLTSGWQVVATSVPGLLKTITRDIQQMMGGRRLGQIAALTNRATSKTNVHSFSVVLHLLGIFSFKHRVVSHQVLQQLTNLIKLAESPFQQQENHLLWLCLRSCSDCLAAFEVKKLSAV